MTERIKFKVLPSFQDVKVGETATFTCTADQLHIWKFNNRVLPPNTLTGSTKTSHWVKIINAQLHNVGYYICIGEDLHKKYFEDYGELNVKVKFFCFSFVNTSNLISISTSPHALNVVGRVNEVIEETKSGLDTVEVS